MIDYKHLYYKYKKKYITLKKAGNIKPYLIITSGPTGSGKSSLPNKIINYLNLNYNPQVKILIDDIVERQESYKKKVLDIKNDYCMEDNNKLCDNFEKKIKNPDNTILNKFSTAYFETRKKKGCDHEINKTCDMINDENLENAFNEGKNIIFETTGTYYPSWIFKYNMDFIKKFDYKIIMAWTIADWCELVKRNSYRAIKSFEDFLIDKSNPTPRLPDIRPDNYKLQAKLINDVFYRIAYNCGKTYRKEFCKIPIQLIVVDNRTINNPYDILYDSEKGSYSPEIEKVFNFTRLSCKKNLEK
jgi:hypothetical protein